MKRALLYPVYVASVLVLGPEPDLSCPSARGQDVKQETQREATQETGRAAGGLEIVELAGELEAVSSNPLGLKIKTEMGESYVAVLARDANLHYEGTAAASFLQPGLLARFIAPFYPQTLDPQAPVMELEIFRPVQKRRMTREEVQSQTPGIHPYQEGRKGKQNGESVKPAPAGMQNYQVVGQIRAVHQGKMQVMAGKFAVVAQLDPAATVKVISGDTFFCVPGDNVEITGLRNPSQTSLIQAETVEITGAKPLGAMPEKDAQAEKPTRRSRLDRRRR